MKKELEKKEITINVIPELAVSTIGLLRGFWPSIVEHLSNSAKEANLQFTNTNQMKEILDEIYEKCIAQTSIREKAKDLLEILAETGKFPDDIAD